MAVSKKKTTKIPPKMVTRSVQIPEDIDAQLNALALETGTSKSKLIRQFLTNSLNPPSTKDIVKKMYLDIHVANSVSTGARFLRMKTADFKGVLVEAVLEAQHDLLHPEQEETWTWRSPA